MRDNNLTKGFLIGFLAGGTVGAIIALLTAPKSGKELRADIKQKSGEYFDEAEKYLATIQGIVTKRPPAVLYSASEMPSAKS